MRMNQTLDAQVRARIQSWIAGTRITQAELAAQIGRNQAWMSRYLSGAFDADLETLKKLAAAFGHPLHALLETPSDPADADFLARVHRLSPAARATVAKLIDAFEDDGSHSPYVPHQGESHQKH